MLLMALWSWMFEQMAESLHQGLAQWIQCKLGKQYLWKKVTLPWESNPGSTPIWGGLATILVYIWVKKLNIKSAW